MIRPAVEKDSKEILQLWLNVSVAAHGFIDQEYWQNCLDLVEKQILPQAETYIYADKRKIKGFISVLDGNYIGALFVKNEFQGQGIGKKLLEYVRRQRPNLSLKVYAQNTQALGFYQKQGFKIISEALEEATGEKELLMAWARGCVSGYQKRHQGDS